MNNSSAKIVFEDLESKFNKYGKSVIYVSLFIWIVIDLLFKFNVL